MKTQTKTRMKRIAIGAAVVGAFVAGAVSMANRRKAKALLNKGVANAKFGIRKVKKATRAKVAAAGATARSRVKAMTDATSSKVRRVGAEIVA